MLSIAFPSTFGTSLLTAYGFSETGRRAGDDNLGWSAQIALFVLFVPSAIAIVGVLRQEAALRRGVRRDLAVVIFLLNLVGGLTFCATYAIDRGINSAWY